ncbi:MAG: Fis family transcriptional regulator [Bacillota bacterium]|jgi:transcriptional regulator with PAS, ATPase and Fis domain|nr:Fis family transcriptional regulator [Bacillota bacterium]
MFKEEVPFGIRVSNIAKRINKALSTDVDMLRIKEDRHYIYELQGDWLKSLLYESAKSEMLIAQIYFQFTPEATPQLGPDELGAGVCIENVGKWEICEHNMSYIRDFTQENSFLKWWYFESIRVKEGGFTRAYFDPYLHKEVITYSVPVYSARKDTKCLLMGVLGIDIDYSDFKLEMNRKLVETIKGDIESVKKNFELVGEREALANQFINVNTFEIISKEKIINELVTKSPEMERVMALAMKAAQSDANVLLQGETGVGKDFWANFIHSRSSFYRGRLVNVNCCALPESLAESEFFGYGKGAFTGAKGDGKAGYFEAANGGTILLNEIGDLPMHMQAKLLNVIQEKSVIRVGETVPRKINFRLIAATNKDLSKLASEEKFREDLYYRLNVVPIHIPPLRDRKDDIFSLIHFFLARNIEKYQESKQLSVELLTTLINYSWPGNIRELENLMERLFVTSNSSVLGEEDLPDNVLRNIAELQTEYISTQHQTEDNGSEQQIKNPNSPPNEDGTFQKPTLKELLEAEEKRIILEKYHDLRSSYKIAKELGISQSQAYQKIKKYTSGN